MYYGDEDDPEREEILPPIRMKRKKGVKVRAVNERKVLASRLLAWRDDTHFNDPLASVYPPSFIMDNRGVKILARLHPSIVTGPEQVAAALGETHEWEDEYSHQVFKIIQVYDRELADHRKSEAAQHKARQKCVKHGQDKARFAEVSNETEDRIRQDVLRRFSMAASGEARDGS